MSDLAERSTRIREEVEKNKILVTVGKKRFGGQPFIYRFRTFFRVHRVLLLVGTDASSTTNPMYHLGIEWNYRRLIGSVHTHQADGEFLDRLIYSFDCLVSAFEWG